MKTEEIIEALGTIDNYYEISEYERRALEEASELLERSKWIPVSEKLPEKEERVLVTAWGDVDIAWFDRYGLWQTEEYTYYSQDDVIAWMFPPEPWKDGEA